MRCCAVLITVAALPVPSWQVGVREPSLNGTQRVTEETPQGDLPKYLLDAIVSAPSCGTTLASYNGVPAKSNGAEQGTGSSCVGQCATGSCYQCVEYVQRYFHKKYSKEKIWPISYAKQMCGSHPSGVSKTSSPRPGDAAVFSWGTYGHTAIISKVGGGNKNIHVVEQNADVSGTHEYSVNDVACYLTAGGAPPPPPSPGGCPHLGYYCGNDRIGSGKDTDTLYYCSGAGAKPVTSKSCGFCVTAVKGKDDYCASAGTCNNVVTGYYCGSDKIGGEHNTLFLCRNSASQGANECKNGCVTAEHGSDDYCA